MARSLDEDLRRWALSGGVAIGGMALVLALFRAPDVTSLTQPASALFPPVLIRADSGVDTVFDEQKILTDPTPLFLPTSWNAMRRGVTRPEPGATFENYAPKYVSIEEGLSSKFPSSANDVATVVEALADAPGPLLAGFGRAAADPPALSARGAFVEIVAQGTGQAVLRQPLADAQPPGEGDWQPLEFLAHVNTMGLVGTLALTHRSGVEGVDDYFQQYLVRTFRVGQRLAPGFYRISVGP